MKTISEALGTLFQPATKHSDWASRPAVISGDQRTFTFSDLERNISLFAKALSEIGVGKEEKVIISSPNSPEYIAIILAVWKIGAVAIPIDFRLTLEEVTNVINRMEPQAFVGSSQSCQAIGQAKGKLLNADLPIYDFASLAQQGMNDTPNTSGDESSTAAFVILTSGTTGVPKGALHDVQTLAQNLAELAEMAEIEPGMSLLLPLPLSHIFGLEVCLVGLLSGACITLTFTPDDFLKALATKSFDVVTAVPALYSAILSLPLGAIDFSKSKILLSGGAALPQSLADEFRNRFKRRLNNGYGSTEMKIIALNLDGPDLSVGKLVPSARAKIMDSDHRQLPDGEVGEICLEGSILMKAYFNQPAETEAVLHQGHYHTGDLGCVKDGYVYISGRDKELINVAGNKVFPCEVEDVLRQHENVKEVAVLGVPHYRLGQLVKAVVVIKDANMSDKLEENEETRREARQFLLNSFKDFCKEHLKKELRPLEWEFRPTNEALPKTMSGKIDKKKLQTVSA
jgi:long-chain acyl-CoA synthetase